MEMAAATWELADEEEEGQCFPSGPPARGGEGRRGEEGSPGTATCHGGATIRQRGGIVPSPASLRRSSRGRPSGRSGRAQRAARGGRDGAPRPLSVGEAPAPCTLGTLLPLRIAFALCFSLFSVRLRFGFFPSWDVKGVMSSSFVWSQENLLLIATNSINSCVRKLGLFLITQ